MSSLISKTPFGMPASDELQQRLKMNKGLEAVGNLKQARAVDPAKAKAAAEEFEATFLAQMMEHMFAGIETDENMGGGEAEDIYRSMMTEQYGKSLAKSGGIGIARNVYEALMKHQEIDDKGATS